jgi:hypothetical protein
MTSHDSTSYTDNDVDTIHQLLRHLKHPTYLDESNWAASCLVARMLHNQPHLSRQQAVAEVLTEALVYLTQEAPLLADLLRGRFWEELTVAKMCAVGRPEHQSESRFYVQQRQALARFTALLCREEARCIQRRRSTHLLRRLPFPSYRHIFGFDAYIHQVRQYILSQRQYPILSIKGIGGSGKTTLADAVVRSVIREETTLRDVVWISAKQEYLTDYGKLQHSGQTYIWMEQLFDGLGYKLGMHEVVRLPLEEKIEKLAELLRADRYLIVFDNLESVEDFQQLMPWLLKLASPTQFLLTARETIPSANTFALVEIGELDYKASAALIESIAVEKEVRDFDPNAIYDLVGGNPLALILTVSQMQFLPSRQVLEGIRAGSIDELYTFIYWKSWSLLATEAKEILFTIQRAGDQVDWDWLMTTTEYALSQLYKALQQLLDLSLLMIQQDSDGRHLYSIHRLTSTFLRTEVLGWK